MNQLLAELAKVLHLGNDALQNIAHNYPQIREQYIAWESYTKIIEGLKDLGILVGLILVLSVIVTIISFAFRIDDDLLWAKSASKYARRAVVGSILMYVFLQVSITSLQIMRVNAAPEIDAIVKIVEKDK